MGCCINLKIIIGNLLTISSKVIHRLLRVPKVFDVLICEPYCLQEVLQLRDGTERVLHLVEALLISAMAFSLGTTRCF